MEKRTREIIALVMLLALGLIVAGAMAWYIFVGHNWNKAATHIDDLVGSMDGYTVVVYDGVVKRPKPKEATNTSSATLAKEGSSSSASPAGEESGSSASASASSPAPSSSASAAPASDSSAASAVASSANADASAASASSDSASAADSSSSDSAEASDKKVFDAHTIAESYRDKGAAVVELPKDAMRAFEEPEILYRGGKRIGVFSFAGKYRYRFPLFRAQVRYLQQHSVDYVIAIAKDKKLLKGRLDGIDLLVLLRDARIDEGGEFRRQTFCVDSPYVGEAQAVIVSPSGVVTSRAIKEL